MHRSWHCNCRISHWRRKLQIAMQRSWHCNPAVGAATAWFLVGGRSCNASLVALQPRDLSSAAELQCNVHGAATGGRRYNCGTLPAADAAMQRWCCSTESPPVASSCCHATIMRDLGSTARRERFCVEESRLHLLLLTRRPMARTTVSPVLCRDVAYNQLMLRA